MDRFFTVGTAAVDAIANPPASLRLGDGRNALAHRRVGAGRRAFGTRFARGVEAALARRRLAEDLVGGRHHGGRRDPLVEPCEIALRTAGKPVPTNALWIAAIAIEHGLVLYTRDARFLQVPGLACM